MDALALFHYVKDIYRIYLKMQHHMISIHFLPFFFHSKADLCFKPLNPFLSISVNLFQVFLEIIIIFKALSLISNFHLLVLG